MDPLFIVIGVVVGLALGFVVARFFAQSSTKKAADEAASLTKKAAQEAESLVANAKKQAETMRRQADIEAKDQALKYKQEIDEENKERMREVRVAENRVAQREEFPSIDGFNTLDTPANISCPRCRVKFVSVASAISARLRSRWVISSSALRA